MAPYGVVQMPNQPMTYQAAAPDQVMMQGQMQAYGQMPMGQMGIGQMPGGDVMPKTAP